MKRSIWDGVLQVERPCFLVPVTIMENIVAQWQDRIQVSVVYGLTTRYFWVVVNMLNDRYFVINNCIQCVISKESGNG